jgi:ribosomal 30S subunit maturation factor RimM
LIPFLKQFVTKVDIDNKKIFISDLEGLLWE